MSGERIARWMAQQSRRDEIEWRLHQIDPRHVHRTLISYQRVHRKDDPDWSWRAFKAIYGCEPPHDCHGEPLPDFLLIEHWLAVRGSAERTNNNRAA
jgi:hypothetical protein